MYFWVYMPFKNALKVWMGLTLYILISAYIFSIMFFINFLGVDKENLYNNPQHL